MHLWVSFTFLFCVGKPPKVDCTRFIAWIEIWEGGKRAGRKFWKWFFKVFVSLLKWFPPGGSTLNCQFWNWRELQLFGRLHTSGRLVSKVTSSASFIYFKIFKLKTVRLKLIFSWNYATKYCHLVALFLREAQYFRIHWKSPPIITKIGLLGSRISTTKLFELNHESHSFKFLIKSLSN